MSMIGEAYPLSFTPANIMSGFRKLGAWPINLGVMQCSFDDMANAITREALHYMEESLSLTIKDIQNSKLFLRKAALQYGVPKSTNHCMWQKNLRLVLNMVLLPF